MKILCVSNKYPPDVVGGAEGQAALLCERLVAGGDEVHVLTTGDRACGSGRRDTRNGVAVTRAWPGCVFMPPAGTARVRSVAQQLWAHVLDLYNPRAVRAMDALLRACAPDVVHTHNLYGLSPAIWACAKRAGVPVVHTAHDCYLLHPYGNLIHAPGTAGFSDSLVRRFYERVYLPRSSAVDVFCGPTRHHVELHRRRGCRAGATRVVPDAVEPGQERVQKAAGAALQVLSMGRLDRHKGVDTLLAAVRRLAGRHDIHLHVAGTGRLAPGVRAAASEGGGVTYHGYVDGDRRAGLLAQADVLVFGSRCLESFGLAIVEAFASGAAALVTDVGGQAELVADGQAGFHFAPGDAAALAGLLARLADDRALLRTLQDGAWQARARYVPARMVDAYREIYASAGGKT